MGHGANVSALSQRLVQREQSGLLTASIFEWHFLGHLGRSHSRVSVCVCVCLCVCVHALYYFSLQAWNNHAMQQYHWAARPATQWLCFLPTHHSPSCFPAKPATLHLMEFLKSTQVWLFFFPALLFQPCTSRWLLDMATESHFMASLLICSSFYSFRCL